MDPEPEIEQIQSFLKQNRIPLLVGCIGLLFLGYGLITFLDADKSEEEVEFQAAGAQTAENSPLHKTVVIDVAGAVVKPGVYTLSEKSRIQDALIAAGGLSEKADRIAVARQLNLAALVSDASKLYVPFLGEQAVSGAGTASQTPVININTATDSQLDSLPGIGKVTAQKIIDNRPFQTPDELVQKKVVSKKVFDQIKDRVSIY